MATVHTLPVDDLLEHDSDGEQCACLPHVEVVSGGFHYIHNAWDGRE